MSQEKAEEVDYTFRISLKGVKPFIWRRIKVSSDMFLIDFHSVIQVAMGWRDCHLHQFKHRGELYQFMGDDEEQYEISLDEMDLSEGSTMLYTYDFGDNWEHNIKLEKITPKVEDEVLPIILAGKNAGPPEDSGGCRGFQEFKETLVKKEGEEYDEAIEWLEFISMEGYDPDLFDLNATNDRMRIYFPASTWKLEKKESKEEMVYIFKATVCEIKPKIWRRMKVSSKDSLRTFADNIQVFFGWCGIFLHRFVINGRSYQNERDRVGYTVNLDELGLEKGSEFVFVHDHLANHWTTLIQLEEIRPKSKKETLPLCMAGKRAGPPDEIGGVGSYEDMIKALKKGEGEEYEDFQNWFKIQGKENFDPEKFDRAAVNPKMVWVPRDGALLSSDLSSDLSDDK